MKKTIRPKSTKSGHSTPFKDSKKKESFFAKSKTNPQVIAHQPLIQTKLKIGKADSELELAADQMAEKVVNMPDPKIADSNLSPALSDVTTKTPFRAKLKKATSIQRKEKMEEEEGALIQRKASQSVTPKISPKVEAGIQSLAGGESLSTSERNYFEPRFGADFSDVKIHKHSKGAAMADSIQARAFTYGRNIVFGKGAYNNNLSGKKLMAHELTHVTQQRPNNKIHRSKKKIDFQKFKDKHTVVGNWIRKMGVKFEAHNVMQFELFQIVDENYGNKFAEVGLTFAGGKKVALLLMPRRRFKVKLEKGAWSPVVPFDFSMNQPVMRILPTGEIQFEGTVRASARIGTKRTIIDAKSLISGPEIHHFRLVNKKWVKHITDFSTQDARIAQGAKGGKTLMKGDVKGLAQLERAYKERIEHDRISYQSFDPEPRGKDREVHFAEAYGETVAKAVVHLFGQKKLSTAKAIQKAFVDRLFSFETSPFKDYWAISKVLNGYYKIVIATENVPFILQMLPPLNESVMDNGNEAALDHKGSLQLRKLAEAELVAGRRDQALKLFQLGASTHSMSQSNQLLGGKVSPDGTKYIVKTAGGKTLYLDMVMDGVTMDYDGLSSLDNDYASVRARQITFSNQWKVRAEKLKIFSPDELAQLPPTAEVMQRYFTAKYNKRMPGAFIEMRTELKEYMDAAFLHSVIDVPDQKQIWNSQQLPQAADSRWVGDCGVMTRAVLNMLKGISGIEFRPIVSSGHIRLLVITKNQREGLVESNSVVRELLKGGSLKRRVERTIGKFSGLQVLHNMPESLSVGPRVKRTTKQSLDDALDTSTNAAEKKRPTINPRLYKEGEAMTSIIHRYDNFTSRRYTFLSREWPSKGERVFIGRKADLNKKRADLAKEQGKLLADLNKINIRSTRMKQFKKKIAEKIRYYEAFLKGETEESPFE